ncbi:hypothetical protein [Actinokineospora sp. NPDC004072]
MEAVLFCLLSGESDMVAAQENSVAPGFDYSVACGIDGREMGPHRLVEVRGRNYAPTFFFVPTR